MSVDPSQRRLDRLPPHLRIESEPLDEPDEQNGTESEEYEDFDDGDEIIEDPADNEWESTWC